MERHKIIAEAREWINTPFQHQGRTKGTAVDCIGLIYGVAKNLGIAPDGLPQEFIGYTRIPDNGKLEQALDKYMDRIRMSEVQPGDVYLMAYSRHAPQHVGITTGKTLIHAFARKCVEHTLSNSWRRRICGAYRFR